MDYRRGKRDELRGRWEPYAHEHWDARHPLALNNEQIYNIIYTYTDGRIVDHSAIFSIRLRSESYIGWTPVLRIDHRTSSVGEIV